MSDRPLRLRLHAVLREAAAVETIDLTVAADATPRDAFDAAAADIPALDPWRSVVAFGTDERLVPADRPIPSDIVELHALPPVSGG